MSAKTILAAKYPADVVDALLCAYQEIEQNYFLRKWKASELDAGHFVEASRRLLEHVLFGAATPIGKPLSNFNEIELKKYEQAKGDEALRILIPRVLWSVYGIRNKRGVGHVGTVSPNQMDSSLILANVKWVLAEFVRLTSGLSTSNTQKLVDDITERRLELIWKHDDVTRVLDSSMNTSAQVLLLLYDTSPQKVEGLQGAVEYKNSSAFRGILDGLHSKRLIEFKQATGDCVITTKGMAEAERLARKAQLISS